MNQQRIEVRVLIGAQNAYACIKTANRSLDVQLAPGKSASTAMKEVAAEMREKADRLIERAQLVEAAAEMVTP